MEDSMMKKQNELVSAILAVGAAIILCCVYDVFRGKPLFNNELVDKIISELEKIHQNTK
jgi:hypothetical protein